MLRDIRKSYEFSTLTEENVSKDPFEQFQIWLEIAINSNELEPTAMVISTVDEHLQPHSRVVLLKDFNQDGLVFYTNYAGAKGTQIAANPKISVLFFWQNFERQVRITGIVEKVSEKESEEYFKSRPIDSQIGAWSSPQSTVIQNHESLDEKFTYYKNKFGDEIPRPEHWGGYLIRPTSFEFWQGRKNRLHDRIFFSKIDDNNWKIERLAP